MVLKRLINNIMVIDQDFLNTLLDNAKTSPRLRINFDLRTSNDDGSQRMLNAMIPGTEVAIHRHPMSNENVILITGRLDEVFYEEVTSFTEINDSRLTDVVRSVSLKEVGRIHLCPTEGTFGCQVPKGVWHTVEVIEPSVIYEGKDGKYGEDGSETFGK